MERYAYLIGAVALGIFYFGVIYLYQRRRAKAGTGHSWLSYVLVWPLIFDADKAKREGRFLTGREWLGWGLVVLIVILAIVLTPHRGAG